MSWAHNGGEVKLAVLQLRRQKIQILNFLLSLLFTQSSRSLKVCARFKKKQNFRTPKKLFPLQSRSSLFPLTLAIIAQEIYLLQDEWRQNYCGSFLFIVKRKFKANVRLWCYGFQFERGERGGTSDLKVTWEFKITVIGLYDATPILISYLNLSHINKDFI